MEAPTRVPGGAVDADAITEGADELAPDSAPPGLGRYLVIDEIGRGGMGVVMRAYDPKLQREVALKLLGTRDPIACARMVREARAMARLAHPHIVAVHDVESTPDGRIYIAMELVRGETLAEWMRQPRAWPLVVERFVAAGRGLAAAHDAGLLHRDFKPGNVLVGADGRVRVTDFGIARIDATNDPTLADDGAADASDPFGVRMHVTEAGSVMGTPPYMAPEQHVPGPLGTAADQYSFCVAFWEALNGALPFAGRGERLVEAKRAGPPAWPVQSEVPRRIAAAITRGLACDPAARWPSMHALLHAIESTGTPVHRRVLVGGVALVGVAMAVGLARPEPELCGGADARLADVWTTARRERIETSLAAAEAPYLAELAPRLTAEIDAYAQTWKATHTEACEATRVRGEQSDHLLDRRMACLERARVGLDAALEVLVSGDSDVLRHAHEIVGGLPPLPRCSDAESLQADVEPPEAHEAAAVDAVRHQLARARSLRDAGKNADALAVVTEASTATGSLQYAALPAEVAFERGVIEAELGDWSAAKKTYLEVLRVGAAQQQWHEVGGALQQLARGVAVGEANHADALAYLELARGLAARSGDPLDDAAVHNTAGIILRNQGEHAAAEAEHREALAIRERVLGPRHRAVVQSLVNLGIALEERGAYDEAAAHQRRALAVATELWGPSHPSVAHARQNLADILREQGDYAQAEAEYRATLALKLRAYGPDHREVASTIVNLGLALVDLGELAQAREQFEEAMRILVEVRGPDHPDVAVVRVALAQVLWTQGDPRAAASQCRAALAILEHAYGAAHPSAAATRSNLAGLLDELGETEAAGREYAAAVAALEAVHGPDHLDVSSARHSLAAFQESHGNLREAEANYRRALAIRERAGGPDHPLVAETLAAMVDVVQRHDVAEARALLERAWTIRRDRDTSPSARAQTAFALARMLWSDRAERTRARELAERAIAEYERAEDADAADVDRVRHWLASRR